MKRLLLPLLAALALPTAVNAGVDPAVHNLCKDVSDYMGCVKANSKKEGWNPFKKTANQKTNEIEKTTKVKKQRPAWMVQKLKGCFKYADETKKNYCIKTYSPYGNPIPLAIKNSNNSVDPSKDEKSKLKGSEISISETIRYFSGVGDSGARDQTTFKGKTYTASRSCPEGEDMYWRTQSGFMRKTKVEELGCMTASQNEAYWREYKLRQAGAPRVTGGGSNIMLKQQIHNNRMNNIRNQFNQQQLQYQQNYQPQQLPGGMRTTPGGEIGY